MCVFFSISLLELCCIERIVDTCALYRSAYNRGIAMGNQQGIKKKVYVQQMLLQDQKGDLFTQTPSAQTCAAYVQKEASK